MSEILKWIAGLAAAIIAGVVIWSLTYPGGVINPLPPPSEPTPPTPNVKIIDFSKSRDYESPSFGIAAYANISVFNEGDTTAEECRVKWQSSGLNFAPTVTKLFSLPPGATRSFTLQSDLYTEPGTYKSVVYVECSNFRSSNIYRNVYVYRTKAGWYVRTD